MAHIGILSRSFRDHFWITFGSLNKKMDAEMPVAYNGLSNVGKNTLERRGNTFTKRVNARTISGKCRSASGNLVDWSEKESAVSGVIWP